METTEPSIDWITVSEAAIEARCSARTINYWRDWGWITGMEIRTPRGVMYVYDRHALRLFLVRKAERDRQIALLRQQMVPPHERRRQREVASSTYSEVRV